MKRLWKVDYHVETFRTWTMVWKHHWLQWVVISFFFSDFVTLSHSPPPSLSFSLSCGSTKHPYDSSDHKFSSALINSTHQLFGVGSLSFTPREFLNLSTTSAIAQGWFGIQGCDSSLFQCLTTFSVKKFSLKYPVCVFSLQVNQAESS